MGLTATLPIPITGDLLASLKSAFPDGARIATDSAGVAFALLVYRGERLWAELRGGAKAWHLVGNPPPALMLARYDDGAYALDSDDVPRKATDPTALEALHHPLDEDEIGVLLPPLPIRRR